MSLRFADDQRLAWKDEVAAILELVELIERDYRMRMHIVGDADLPDGIARPDDMDD